MPRDSSLGALTPLANQWLSQKPLDWKQLNGLRMLLFVTVRPQNCGLLRTGPAAVLLDAACPSVTKTVQTCHSWWLRLGYFDRADTLRSSVGQQKFMFLTYYTSHYCILIRPPECSCWRRGSAISLQVWEGPSRYSWTAVHRVSLRVDVLVFLSQLGYHSSIFSKGGTLFFVKKCAYYFLSVKFWLALWISILPTFCLSLECWICNSDLNCICILQMCYCKTDVLVRVNVFKST